MTALSSSDPCLTSPHAQVDAYLMSIGNPSRMLRQRMLDLCEEAPAHGIKEPDLVIGTAIALARVATWLENNDVDAERYRRASGDDRQYIDVNIACKVTEISEYLARAFYGTRSDRIRAKIEYWIGSRSTAPRSPGDFEEHLLIHVTAWFNWRSLGDVAYVTAD